MRNRETIEKSSTWLVVAMMIASGGVNIAGIKPPFAAAETLGYPGYVPVMLGVAKLLGVLTFLTPRMPTLREWAYAGFTFELLGAACSHLIKGTGALHIAAPLIDLAIVMTSYATWRHSRQAVAVPTPARQPRAHALAHS
jgi:hypothetical protein